MAVVEPCSFSNPNQCICTHISWIVDLNFDTHILECVADLTFEVKQDGIKYVGLDTSELAITSVHDKKSGDKLSFKLGDKHEKFGTALYIDLPQGLNKGSQVTITIAYKTSANASAVQWLKPEQTSGKKHPYFFTQCQAIHARSIIPCQDSPGIKTTYTAQVSVPKGLVALMSALREGETVDPKDSSRTVYKFKQEVCIPSYLIAMVVGALECRKVGPRSHVWTEKEMLEECAYEFAEMETMVSSAESLVGEYVWGLYDLLILPPSFPYGGMENPCLTFVTPTLLAGDRSLTSVVAHEIAHSWTGNLVTNRTWEHFWMNEGFTVFLERKIIGRMKGEKMRQFAFIGGWKTLIDAVSKFGAESSFTKLVVTLKDNDPDEAFSSLPYEKGSCFLFYLEQLVGGPDVFEPFFYKYINTYKHKTVTSEEFKAFFLDYFKDKGEALKEVDWDTWLYGVGMPPVNMLERYDTTLSDSCTKLCQRWINASKDDLDSFSLKDLEGFSSAQIVEFLAQLLVHSKEKPFPLEYIDAMEKAYSMNQRKNNEIRFRWLRLAVRSNCKEALRRTLDFVLEQGRMKYVRPLYEELYKCGGEFRALAVETFTTNRSFYHPICATMIAKDLNVK